MNWPEIFEDLPSPFQHSCSEIAHELFLSCLSPKQAEQFAANECIDVIGSEGGHFRIHCNGRSFSFNIIGGFNRFTHVRQPLRVRPDSTETACMTLLPWLFCYCASAKGGYILPVWDHYLTQKSWIEADERGFMLSANVLPISTPPWDPFGGIVWKCGMPT